MKACYCVGPLYGKQHCPCLEELRVSNFDAFLDILSIKEKKKKLKSDDTKCQDAVEGIARFSRPNIPRPSKAIGE